MNRSAVAKAVVDRFGKPAAPDRAKKDTINDAIRGNRASTETIDLLSDTFGWEDEIRQELLVLRNLTGEAAASERDRLLLVIGTDATPAADIGDQVTVAVHEFHQIGTDRLPVLNQTVRTVMSRVENLSAIRYGYLDDEGNPSVEVTVGGTKLTEEHRDDGAVIVHIALPQMLSRGATTSVQYVTRFAYEMPPAPEMRRAVPSGASVVEVRVQFDQHQLPRSVYQTEWDNDVGPPMSVEAVHLDTDGAVSHLWQDTAADFVGFSWQW